MIEMSRKSRSCRVPSSARRTHRAHEPNVYEPPKLTNSFAIVPPSVVHPLSQQLYGRLGTVDLQRRHVEIVNEEDELLAKWRTEYALSTFVEL